MRGKLPREDDRGQATMETLLASLPTRKQAYLAAATGKVIKSLDTSLNIVESLAF